MKQFQQGLKETYSFLTPGLRGFPDFIIIGAQKAGTTSLFSYLASHPNVIPALRKEVHFFDSNYARGVNWYKAHFPTNAYKRNRQRRNGTRVLTGEASPYYMFHPHAAKRTHELLPDVKLIVMLRDPIDRAFSHYQHQCRKGRETRAFAAALDAEPETLAREREKMAQDPGYQSMDYATFSYLARGIYADQIADWLQYYRRDQMLILNSESFFSEPQASLDKTLDFLGLSEFHLKNSRAHNAGGYSDRLEKDLGTQLRDYFRPHNERLFELIGESYDWSN